MLQGQCQRPFYGLLALRPPLQGWPRRLFGGEQAPLGSSGPPPANGGFGARGDANARAGQQPPADPGMLRGALVLAPGPAPKCLPAEGIPPSPAAGTAPSQTPHSSKGCPSVHPSIHSSAHPVLRRSAGSHGSPAPRAGIGLGAARSRRPGHRTCRGSSAVPGTTAQPQKQEAASTSFLPPQENHRLTQPGRKRGGGRKCSRVAGFRMKPGWK